MSKQRYFTNGMTYTGKEIREAREALGPVRYRQYGGFGPSLTDNHAGSYPAIESFTAGGYIFEVYEYECMTMGFGGYVSAPHRERAVRFMPVPSLL